MKKKNMIHHRFRKVVPVDVSTIKHFIETVYPLVIEPAINHVHVITFVVIVFRSVLSFIEYNVHVFLALIV